MDNDGKTSTGTTHNDIEGIESIYSYTLNTNHYITQINNDSNADGEVDSIEYLVNNANGHNTAKYFDNDASSATGKTVTLEDGRTVSGIDSRDARVLDARGYIIEYLKDNDGDGIYDYRNYDVRNANGQQIGVMYDTDNNSATGNTVTDINGRTVSGIERLDYREINGNGHLIKIETDNGADGSIDRITYDERDSNGYWLGNYVDNDNNTNTGSTYTLNDGRVVSGIDSRETNVLDAYGRVSKVSYDYNTDGVPDRIEYFVRDAYGYVVERYFNFDGKEETGLKYTVNGEEVSGIERFSSYTLNERGKIITALRDNQGKFERTYDVYNNKDQLVELYEDRDNDPTTGGTFVTEDGRTLQGVNRVEYREYNDIGSHVFSKIDTNGDGQINQTVRYVRSEGNAITHLEFISPYINEADQRITSIDFHNTTNHHEDFTTSDWATRLETVGGRLNRIHFLYDTTVDSLTIDSKTIANFVNETTKRLNITGNEHKTVYFTDFTEANQLSETRYQFELDGNTYTVNVDAAVNVVLG